MRRLFRLIVGIVAVVFVLPALAHGMVWASLDRPVSWYEADWSSSKIFSVPEVDAAAVYIMTARTGGMKGAVSSHSWIVLKKPGRRGFDRYDVVGWGTPVRKNAYAADGLWYSNQPKIHYVVRGARHGRSSRRSKRPSPRILFGDGATIRFGRVQTRTPSSRA